MKARPAPLALGMRECDSVKRSRNAVAASLRSAVPGHCDRLGCSNMLPMAAEPTFASIGTEADTIDVRLSYKIVELFSEGLYASPNKAIEELVANSFDAGARGVHVILSDNLHADTSTIVVIDDGEGMDAEGLKQLWLIGISNKRHLPILPRGRQQIGKFGIGKLATYVLANRLTHISKCGGKYYSTSMDYGRISNDTNSDLTSNKPIQILLRELTASQANQAVQPWVGTQAFKVTGAKLFGKGSSNSWTVSIMSSLKDKVHEIKPGMLRWVLSTALPLRPDFRIWLNGEKLVSSKQNKGILKRWTIGKELIDLARPSPKGITKSEHKRAAVSSEHRFGLEVPGLGRITGYAEAYADLLTGKSDEIGRSHGFFVYVKERLLNVTDGHFGISPNELRHGTFGRLRVVVHIDGLDEGLRSNREAVGEGPLLQTAQDVLRGIFNTVRPTIDIYEEREDPTAKLARKFAATPTSLSRAPILKLTRDVAEGKSTTEYLRVPIADSVQAREEFLAGLERHAHEADDFVAGVSIDLTGTSREGLAHFDTQSRRLVLNGWHPFVATFHEEFSNAKVGEPLKLLAMAEVLAEAELHRLDFSPEDRNNFLSERDQLLRSLANESGRQSALATANALRDARNSSSGLEESVCDAFRSLGFDVTPFGKSGEPDGVASAHLPADESGLTRNYRVSLEAKSTEQLHTRISARRVNLSGVIRHRDKHQCNHAIVVGPVFSTKSGNKSAIAQEIEHEQQGLLMDDNPKTVTLVTIDDLAKLVLLRPIKQLGLQRIRELFQTCRLDTDSAGWINEVADSYVTRPPYREIIETIGDLQRDFPRVHVNYGALRVKLSLRTPPIKYETDSELEELCKGMAQMAPRAMYASDRRVELDQSVENVISEIETAMQSYPSKTQVIAQELQ